jgi:putative ABC transport system permease protein
MIQNYFKIAWRSLLKNKGTTAINIVGLSVGMTAAVFILLWVQNEMNFDDYHKEEGSIYRLTTRLPTLGWVWETTPLLLADAIKKEVPEITNATRLYTSNWPVFTVKNNQFYSKSCAYVDEAWFNIFKYDFKEGNAAAFDANPFSIILTNSEAKKYFGNAAAAGQTIRVDSVNYQVRGVVSDPLTNSSFQYTSFIPISALLTNPQIRENEQQWNNANYITFVKTTMGSKPGVVEKKITAVMASKSKGDATPITMIALKDLHFETEISNSAFIHGNLNTVYVFSILGFLLLLIACINYVNLTTARASLRAREVSVRKINGADRSHLFLQFITESLLISLLSLAATLVLIKFCLPVFNQLTEKSFELPLTSVNVWKVLGCTLLAALLLNSIYPALLLSSFKPLNVFRGNNVLKVKDSSFRKGLVILQFTVSVILIASTIVIYSQLQFIQHKNPGYNRSQIISFALPQTIERGKRESVMTAMKHDLLAESSIENVATSNQPLVNLGSVCTECADWKGRDTSYNPRITQLSADIDFEKTLQLKMKEGEWFGESNNNGALGFILNETAVKDFKLPVPTIGAWFVFKGDTGRVIGVVNDFVYKSLHEKLGAVVVFNNALWRNFFSVRIADKKATVALSNINKVWKNYVGDSPLEYNFLDDTFNNLYKQDQQTAFLMIVFAVIAIVISGLGLFSLAAFEAAQRTKEIGVRKVLGATVAGIARLLSKYFVKLVCIAIVIASPIAFFAMNKWIQNFAYRIDITWWMFALAGLFALVIALLTVSFQAVKAALMNPVKSLKTE